MGIFDFLFGENDPNVIRSTDNVSEYVVPEKPILTDSEKEILSFLESINYWSTPGNLNSFSDRIRNDESTDPLIKEKLLGLFNYREALNKYAYQEISRIPDIPVDYFLKLMYKGNITLSDLVSLNFAYPNVKYYAYLYFGINIMSQIYTSENIVMLHDNEIIINEFQVNVYEDRVTSRDVNYYGVSSSSMSFHVGSYEYTRHSNKDTILTISSALMTITNQRIILSGYTTDGNEKNKVIRLGSLLNFDVHGGIILLHTQTDTVEIHLTSEYKLTSQEINSLGEMFRLSIDLPDTHIEPVPMPFEYYLSHDEYAAIRLNHTGITEEQAENVHQSFNQIAKLNSSDTSTIEDYAKILSSLIEYNYAFTWDAGFITPLYEKALTFFIENVSKYAFYDLMQHIIDDPKRFKNFESDEIRYPLFVAPLELLSHDFMEIDHMLERNISPDKNLDLAMQISLMRFNSQHSYSIS